MYEGSLSQEERKEYDRHSLIIYMLEIAGLILLLIAPVLGKLIK